MKVEDLILQLQDVISAAKSMPIFRRQGYGKQ